MNALISGKTRGHSLNWIGDIPLLGPEDITIDQDAGVAYVSSQNRLAAEWLIPGVVGQRGPNWAEGGGIYCVDLRSGLSTRELAVVLPDGGPFHPAGIDLYTGPGEKRLFIVNWRTASESTVEVFSVGLSGLTYVDTARSRHLTCPNDIVAISEQQFYVSNSLTFAPSMQWVEKAFCLPTGDVLFHDLDGVGTWRRVAHGIPYANGLAVDRKRHRLFVASTLSSRLLAFPWNPARPWEALASPARLHLDFLPDNLGWEDENTLWAAGSDFVQSIFYTLMLRGTAPSHVARIPLADAAPGDDPFEEVHPQRMYDNDGTEISQCSVGVPYQANGERRFMVGSCFDDHVSAFRRAA